MAQLSFIYKRNSIQLITWPIILAMLLTISSCNVIYSGSKNRKKIEKHFGKNTLKGDININELSELLHKKSTDSTNLTFIDSILTFQNIGFFFDSTGYIKDLLGSDYKRDLENISLAIDYYNFDRPITIPTAQNRLPEKLNFHFNDILSIVNKENTEKIINFNNLLILIVPNQTNKVYFKTVEHMNWLKRFERNKSDLLLLRE